MIQQLLRREAMVHVEAPTVSIACGKILQNERGLTFHRTQTHLKNSDAMRRMRMLTMTNACPWCAYQFTTKRSLRDHIRTRDWRGTCPRSSRGAKCSLRLNKDLKCARCGWKAKDIGDLHAHVLMWADETECQIPPAAPLHAETPVTNDSDDMSISSCELNHDEPGPSAVPLDKGIWQNGELGRAPRARDCAPPSSRVGNSEYGNLAAPERNSANLPPQQEACTTGCQLGGWSRPLALNSKSGTGDGEKTPLSISSGSSDRGDTGQYAMRPESQDSGRTGTELHRDRTCICMRPVGADCTGRTERTHASRSSDSIAPARNSEHKCGGPDGPHWRMHIDQMLRRPVHESQIGH